MGGLIYNTNDRIHSGWICIVCHLVIYYILESKFILNSGLSMTEIILNGCITQTNNRKYGKPF